MIIYNIITYSLEWQKNLTIPNVGKDAELLELSYTAAGDAKWLSHFGKSLVVSYEVKYILTI